MKDKIAMFIEPSALNMDNARPLGEWAEEYQDSYVRVTEYVEVEFDDLPDAVAKQIESLRVKQERLRTDAAENIGKIDELIKSLSALEHMPV